MHVLGAVGNYAISNTLQSVFTAYGLEVHHDGDEGYALSSVDGGFDIDQICPPSILRDGNVFDVDNLRRFGEFLHQPIRTTLARAMPEADAVSGLRKKMAQRSEREATVHDGRAAIHRMLRFAVTGSVEIPPDEQEGLDKDSAECHAETEQAIRDADTWKSEIEFGNDETKISAIPDTSFSSDKGFTLKLNTLNPQDLGENQRNLDTAFWSIVNRATGGRYIQSQSEITLSGAELESLCMHAKGHDLEALIDRVEFEEAVQEKLTSIQARISRLSSSPLLDSSEDKSKDLHNLMSASSALTPVLDADFMRDAWAKHNFTARHASPLEGLQKEMAVFLSVAQAQIERGQTSPAQMEAIATEFYSLIAFSGHVVDAINDGLGKQVQQGQDADLASDMRVQLTHLKDIFDHASICDVRLDTEFLSQEQRDALETLQKHAGKADSLGGRVRSAAKAPMKAGGETLVDFTGDVVNFIREDPKIATGFVALAATLIAMKGGDPNAVSDAAFSVGLAISDDGELVSTAINADHIPRDLFGTDNFHWDLKFSPLSGYELYKHFANANFIVGPAQQFMELTRGGIHSAYGMLGIPQNYTSAYDAAATSVIQPLSEKLFAVNMFQNVSHAAFWMWAGTRGYQHGTKGVGQILELSAPVVDLAYHGGVSVIDAFKKKTALSDHLLEMSDGPLQVKYLPEVKPPSLVITMAKTAEMRAALSEGGLTYQSAISIDAMKVPIELDGLKKHFNIHAQNLKPILNSLAKFDHFMEQVGSHVASNEAWHVNHLVETIHGLQGALNAYQISGDTVALDQKLHEGLEYILASELRYRDGKSDVYEALFEAAPDNETLKRLMRSVNTTIGREKRKKAKRDIKKDIIGQGETPLKLTGHVAAQAKLAGVLLWGGMVNGAKTARRMSDRTLNKRNVIIGSAIAAACVGLDMGGAGNDFTDAVSGLTGGSIAASATAATFLNFNFWEDIVGVHLGTGISLIFGGAAVGFAHKKYIKPAMNYAAETKVGGAFNQARSFAAIRARSGMDAIGGRVDDYNTRLGHKVTQVAREYLSVTEYELG